MKKSKLLKCKVKNLMAKNFFYKIYHKICTQFVIQVSKLVKKDSLNIGGGPDFHAIGWLNLEEVKSKFNVYPFKLTPNCIFPLKDCSIKNAFISHCLEHLDSDTVNRVIAESRRALKKGGNFIIKIPDFDLVLNAWKNNDESLFTDSLWCYNSIIDTWKNRKINDCLDYRAAMIFCGFFNDDYGDLFGTKISKDKNPYHGPPVIDVKFLRGLIKEHTPSQISAELRKVVMKEEKDYHFNHCNAWSRSELEHLLVSADFDVVTFDKEKILDEFRHFPGIEAMKEQSMYCWIRKLGNKGK